MKIILSAHIDLARPVMAIKLDNKNLFGLVDNLAGVFVDGFFEKTEDETWIYGNRYRLKTFYFGVPIPGTYYHSTELTVSLDTIDKVTNSLVDVVEWFRDK